MSFLILIFGIIAGVHSATNLPFANLEVVSDLLPQDCLAKNLGYKLVNGLPECNGKPDNKQSCTQFFAKIMYAQMIYKPTSCATDGSFNPVQCKGERTTGRCFCFDKNGQRLFGQQWWPQADNMTCACSRKKADMADPKSENYIFYNSLHCNSVGNFEPLQCDVLSEMCWCSDERTGDLTSSIVPQAAMSKLPCYNSMNVGTQYLRECESKKYAQRNIENQLQLHGTNAQFGDFLCDDDGSYGAYTISDGSAYCIWRDNIKIGSWSSNADARATLNCNCARDSKIFQDAGKELNQQCNSVGNYQPYQGSEDGMYCVDNDGYRKSPPSPDIKQESDCAPYYAFDDLNI